MPRNKFKTTPLEIIVLVSGLALVLFALFSNPPKRQSEIREPNKEILINKNSEEFKSCVKKCESECFGIMPLCDCSGSYCEEELSGQSHF